MFGDLTSFHCTVDDLVHCVNCVCEFCFINSLQICYLIAKVVYVRQSFIYLSYCFYTIITDTILSSKNEQINSAMLTKSFVIHGN